MPGMTLEQQMFAAKAGQGMWPAGTGWWNQMLHDRLTIPLTKAERARARDYNDIWKKGNSGVRDILSQTYGYVGGVPSWVMDAWGENLDWDEYDMLRFLGNPPESTE